MSNSIQILNGDSTASIFTKSTLNGTVVVWREMLCEGPLAKIVGSDDFWKKRYSFFEKEFKISKLEYFDSTIKEIVKIEDVIEVDEVVLWFEYDLFCQINMLAALSYLLQSYRKDVSYYLICTGYSKKEKQWKTLSDFSYEEFPTLYNNKVKLSRHDLVYANECYKVFSTGSKKNIQEFNFNKKPKFKWLSNAIKQHLYRFPCENGLNEIENKMLLFLKEEPQSKNQLIKRMLQWQNKNTVYGFGDLQYEMYLKKLARFIILDKSSCFLNEAGEKIVALHDY